MRSNVPLRHFSKLEAPVFRAPHLNGMVERCGAICPSMLDATGMADFRRLPGSGASARGLKDALTPFIPRGGMERGAYAVRRATVLSESVVGVVPHIM